MMLSALLMLICVNAVANAAPEEGAHDNNVLTLVKHMASKMETMETKMKIMETGETL